MRETKTLFRIVDADGAEYYIVADNLSDAFMRFKRWIEADDRQEWEDPQSVSAAGELIPET